MKQLGFQSMLFDARSHVVTPFVLALLVATLWSGVCLAANEPTQPQIDVRFDRQSYVAGEPFNVEISVTAEGEEDPQISIPAFAGMKVLRKNVSRPSSGYSFSMSFGTGKNAQRVTQKSGVTKYDLVLVAEEPGKFTVGPVKVVLDGYTFKGKSYPIEVFDRGSVSAAPTNAPAAGGQISEAQLAGAKIDADYFLHMVPSKTVCTVGELIVLNVYLFTSVSNIRADQFVKEPGTEGFWVERFEDFDLRNHRNKQVVINNVLYEQVLLKKLALFPTKSGNLTIGSPVFSFVIGGGGFFSFSRGKTVKRSASPITIEVQPLPDNGRPSGFTGANVGHYSFFVNASQKSVKVGEPVTVTVSVRGAGNIRNVELPVFGEVDGFKMYAPETDVEVQARGGDVSGMSQSKTLFIPEKEGRLVIPSLKWSHWNLRAKTYKEVNSDPIYIEVTKGKAPTTVGAPNTPGQTRPTKDLSAIARMNNKMRTIQDDVITTQKKSPLFARTWFLVVLFLTPALFFAFVIGMRLKSRAADNHQKGRSRRAEPVARKSLAALEKETALSNDAFFSKLHKTVLQFLEDRLEEHVVGDTMGQLTERLIVRGFDKALAQKIINALEEYEFARFAKSDGPGKSRSGDIERALAIIGEATKVELAPAATNGATNGAANGATNGGSL